MAVDLFSLRMLLETVGTAKATADLKAVDVAGMQTASSLRGTTAAANQGTIALNGLGTSSAQTVPQLDRAASAALNNTKGYKDLTGAYENQDRVLKELGPTTATTTSRLTDLATKVVGLVVAYQGLRAIGGFFLGAAQAAAEGERVTQRLRIAVNDTGASWNAYRDRIEGSTAALVRNTTFSSTETKQALATLVAGTQDASRAQQLLGVAADLASFKHIGLDQAARILTSTLAGNVRGMKEFGITTKDGEEAVAQLALLLRGQAAGAADTFDGKTKQLKNSWADFKEAVGGFVIGSGLGTFLRNSAREVETLTGWVEKLNRALGFSSGSKAADQDTAALNKELRELRAARATMPAEIGNPSIGLPMRANPELTKNMERQVEIQRELVAREQKRILDERVAANQRASEDEARIKLLAEGLKLGTLTKAEDAERLAIVQKLRAEKAGANLEERNHLQSLINDLLPKVSAATTRAEQARILGLANMDEPMKPAALAFQGFPGTIAPRTDRIDISPGLHAPALSGKGRAGLFEELLRQGETVRRQFQMLGTNLGMTLAGGFASALGAAMQGKNPFKAFGSAVLSGLGSIFTQMGSELIAYGIIMLNLLPFLSNPFTSGPAAIAAGAALVALGTVLGGIATGPGGKGSGGGGAVDRDRTTHITLTQDGAGGFRPPKRDQGQHFTVIGASDPRSHRIIGDINKSASRRNIG